MHSHTLSAGIEPLHDGVLLGRLLLLGEEVGLRDVVRQRRFGYVDLLTIETALGCPISGSYSKMIPKFSISSHHQVVPIRAACIAIGGLSPFLSIRHQALKHEDIFLEVVLGFLRGMQSTEN